MGIPLWDEAKAERLRALWALGHSHTVIGIELGVTRCAVAGKVRRLKLAPRRIKPQRVREPVVIEVEDEPLECAPKKRGRPPREVMKRTQAEYRAMLAEAVRNTKAQ